MARRISPSRGQKVLPSEKKEILACLSSLNGYLVQFRIPRLPEVATCSEPIYSVVWTSFRAPIPYILLQTLRNKSHVILRLPFDEVCPNRAFIRANYLVNSRQSTWAVFMQGPTLLVKALEYRTDVTQSCPILYPQCNVFLKCILNHVDKWFIASL